MKKGATSTPSHQIIMQLCVYITYTYVAGIPFNKFIRYHSNIQKPFIIFFYGRNDLQDWTFYGNLLVVFIAVLVVVVI